jgi:hypothetical protein
MGCILLLAFVGTWVYGFSLRLPFFLDDMVHFRWLQWRGLATIWSSARFLGYYRPLPFTIWKVLAQLQGRHEPVTLHALNLGLHLLNGLLVLGLVTGQRRRGGLGLGLSAALLFLLFPFSYQAVPWVGSLTHPLVTTLTLGSLVSHQAALRAQRSAPALRATSIGLALLAPFAHESGILIASLLVLLLLTGDKPSSPGAALRESFPYWGCTALGLGVWLVVPKGIGQTGLFDLTSRWQNAVYFGQGLGYPVAPLATMLLGRTGRLSDLQAVALTTWPVIGCGSLLFWRARRGRLIALALGWFALAVAPAWLVLGFWYVVDGPRLLYLASVGAALFWAIPVDIACSGGRRSVAGMALAALLVLGAAASGYRFIRARVPLYEQMHVAVAQLLEAQSGAASEPLLCVNYPAWLAPRSSTFALGHEGVTLVPAYTGVRDLLWLHTGEEWSVSTVTLPDLLHPWRYHYATVGPIQTGDSIQEHLRLAKRVIVASYAADDIAIHDSGGLEAENQHPADASLASFDGRIALLSASSLHQDSALRLELRWQCWQRVAQETTVFVHLYDEVGQLVAQADGYPLMGTSRPTFWRPGDVWRDVRLLPLQELAPGRYTVKAGLYPVDGGPRLKAVDPAGQRFQDDAVPIAAVRIP